MGSDAALHWLSDRAWGGEEETITPLQTPVLTRVLWSQIFSSIAFYMFFHLDFLASSIHPFSVPGGYRSKAGFP